MGLLRFAQNITFGFAVHGLILLTSAPGAGDPVGSPRPVLK